MQLAARSRTRPAIGSRARSSRMQSGHMGARVDDNPKGRVTCSNAKSHLRSLTTSVSRPRDAKILPVGGATN